MKDFHVGFNIIAWCSQSFTNKGTINTYGKLEVKDNMHSCSQCAELYDEKLTLAKSIECYDRYGGGIESG